MKKIIINEQFNRMRKIAGLITENESNESSDLEVKWAPEYYKNTKEYGDDAYHEMGLVDAPYAMVGGEKVKEIVGYFYDEDEEEDEEIIGYIFSKSGKDIESYSEDDLDDAFMKAVDIENNRLSESNITKSVGDSGLAKLKTHIQNELSLLGDKIDAKDNVYKVYVKMRDSARHEKFYEDVLLSA